MFRSLSHLLSFLSQQYWFWVVDSAGHREPFRHLLLGYPPKHTEVYHHTGRGSDPSVRECYFLICFFSFTSLQIFDQSFRFSTTIENSYRLRSRKVLDYDQLNFSTMIEKKFSTTIDNNSRLCSSSRLRSRNSSRPRSRKSPRLRSRKSSRLRSITVLDYDREKVLDYDR